MKKTRRGSQLRFATRWDERKRPTGRGCVERKSNHGFRAGRRRAALLWYEGSGLRSGCWRRKSIRYGESRRRAFSCDDDLLGF